MIFEEAMKLTRTVSSEAAYDDDACRLLWAILMRLRPGDAVVEVGCEYGRSTSLILQAASTRGLRVWCVDPFGAPEVAAAFAARMHGLVPFTLIMATTSDADAYNMLPHEPALIHIDGDHSRRAIEADCRHLLWRLRPGGFAAFHDYGRDSLPDVMPVADRNTRGWEVVGTAGTCHVVRKPQRRAE